MTIALPAGNPYASSLEYAFVDLITRDIDTKKQTYETIGDYLEPNERNPEGIIKHLALAEEGYIVATGTERVFFDVLFSSREKCRGIVAVDINSKVIAYVAFNVLLLRISKTLQEYVTLSKTSEKRDITSRVHSISEKMHASDCPEPMKRYYDKHLMAFAKVYLLSPMMWKSENESGYFGKCRYDLDNEQFLKLRNYAREGNIIAVHGTINDLRFLKEKKIAVVDTSNISDYTFIDLQGEGDFRPRVIYTSVGIRQRPEARYYSHQHVSLSDELRKAIDDAIACIGTSLELKMDAMSIQNYLFGYGEENRNEFDQYNGAIYSQNMRTCLENRIRESILDVPGFGLVNMENKISKLNSIPIDQIKKMIEEGECDRFLAMIVRQWRMLNTNIYLAFSQIPGWGNAFEKQFSLPYEELSEFLAQLQTNGHLDHFIAMFSQERLLMLQGKRSENSNDQKPQLIDAIATAFTNFVKSAITSFDLVLNRLHSLHK